MGSAVAHDAAGLVGADILGLITSGIYADPLTVYREYIQNAADSFGGEEAVGTGRIEVTIARKERRVTIRDNGPGLSVAEAMRALIPVAASEKRGDNCRGFRGIGRLAGLAFAESVTFLTRSGLDGPIVRVFWDGCRLRRGIEAGDSLGAVLAESVEVDTAHGDGHAVQFFEVSVEGVSRYAAGLMMNHSAVRKYIGETCPVPFADDFPYGGQVADLLGDQGDPLVLDVRLDGEEEAVRRPHGRSVGVSDGGDAEFVGFEEIRIGGLGDRVCAVGWIAHTPYRGAIPRECGVRGVRLRVGNMQIGGEGVIDHLFSEDRFNRWCVAEVHVLDPAMVPNARRDYFESGPHLRNFENQLGAICRRIERKCRSASKERLGRRRYRGYVARAEGTLDLAATGYLNPDRTRKLVADMVLEIASWKEKCRDLDWARESMGELKGVEEKLRSFRAQGGQGTFAGMDASEMAIYQEVFGIIADVSQNPKAAKQTIETILETIGRKAGALAHP